MVAKNSAIIINVCIRGGTLASKFLLILVLARFLTPAELGLYGLIIATIAYGIYPLGFEFYTYSTREIIGLEESQRGVLLKSQLALHVKLYLFFLPLFLFLFFFEFLPWAVWLWFYLLLVLEHLNQELFRLLIAMSKQLSASIALFFRQGLWAIAVAACMYFDSDFRNIEFVFLSWAIGSFIGLLISVYVIATLPISGWGQRVDWQWIKKGLKVAIPFFIATIGVNGVMTIDKYIFDFISGKELLGAYVFYLALSASLISFLDAGIFSFIYPSMVSAAKSKNYNLLYKKMKIMLLQVVVLSFIFLLIMSFSIDYILKIINKDIYRDNYFLFYFFFAAMLIQAISYVPHYGLYSKDDDTPIVLSGFLSFFVFVLSVWVLSFFDSILAVPISLIITYMFVLFWKSFSFKKSLEYVDK